MSPLSFRLAGISALHDQLGLTFAATFAAGSIVALPLAVVAALVTRALAGR